jgi:hypothetical protein
MKIFLNLFLVIASMASAMDVQIIPQGDTTEVKMSRLPDQSPSYGAGLNKDVPHGSYLLKWFSPSLKKEDDQFHSKNGGWRQRKIELNEDRTYVITVRRGISTVSHK